MSTIILINVIPYKERTRTKRITYEQVKKACGKTSCRVCHGVRPAHGPYWYKVEWDAHAHKQRTLYIGKTLPADAEEALLTTRLLADPTLRYRLSHTQQLSDALARQQRENIALRAQIVRLETALAAVRAHVSRLHQTS
jgi:hypothetical protein